MQEGCREDAGEGDIATRETQQCVRRERMRRVLPGC